MQIAQTDDSRQCLRQNVWKENKPRLIILFAAKYPPLKARLSRVQLVPSVVSLFATNHDKEHVRPLATDAISHTHENVEAAHRFQAARHIRHYFAAGRKSSATQKLCRLFRSDLPRPVH